MKSSQTRNNTGQRVILQTTIASSITLRGVALHAGTPVTVTVQPAPADFGIVFDRVDLARSGVDTCVRVAVDSLIEANLCTLIGNDCGVTVSTIEHLMAALAGCGIHNALVSIDGPEVPILDGSASPFVAAFMQAGIRRLPAPLRAIRVRRIVEVREGSAFARLEPADHLSIAFEIDFPDRAIGRQHKELCLSNGTFVRELSDSRTFCRQADVDLMHANGLALGGSYANAVVVQDDLVLTPGGMRHADEPVRHKMLDAMGDLAVAGAPILGRYVGHRAGHTLTGRLVRALLSQADSHERVTVSRTAAYFMPGAGVCRVEPDLARAG